MLTKYSILIVLSLNIIWILADTSTGDIPSCHEKDTNVNDCLRNAFQQMIPRAKNGIPELNVPPMDPFVINRTNYAFSHTIISGKIGVRNLTIRGLSKTIVDSVDYQRKGNKVKMYVKARIPKILIEGTYKAKIQLNAAKINSRGPFNVTITDVDVLLKPDSELYESDGHTFTRLVGFDWDPTLGNMQFYAEGLLPEPLLNDAILEFINQNWRTIYKTLVPETRVAWEPEFIKLGNEYFSHVPLDALLTRD